MATVDCLKIHRMMETPFSINRCQAVLDEPGAATRPHRRRGHFFSGGSHNRGTIIHVDVESWLSICHYMAADGTRVSKLFTHDAL